MMTPCGMYMNAIRTGGLAGAAARASESINGRASVTPVPLRKVRRSMLEACFIFIL